MRFSPFLISALAALVTAAPNSLEVLQQEQVADTIVFAMQSSDCHILKCAKVIASAVCIGLGIAAGPAGIKKVISCVGGGAHAVCCGPDRVDERELMIDRFARARRAFTPLMSTWLRTMFAEEGL
jgi:hypothetical protein